jgi:DNA-binding transcriptional regulator YhcF (GntR family)
MKVDFSHSRSKNKALADAVSAAIMHGELQVGDNLPSINEASAKFAVSRDTVFKAYKELKRRGLIDSNPQKGYFVRGEVHHVLLLLDNYSPFKQHLYKRFRSRLPDNYKVDIIFHQYNQHLFETIIRESMGRYSMYAVMNFSNTQFSEVLKMIPNDKLLLLDFGGFEKSDHAFLCQDFDQALYDSLQSFRDALRKYHKMVLVFPEDNCHPVSAIEFFKRFARDENFECVIVRNPKQWKGVEQGAFYLCIETDDLVRTIHEADRHGFELGKDIGLMAYNDDPILDVIRNGITSIGIDFGLLGEKAAEYIMERKLVQEYLPTSIRRRNSV